MIGYLALVLAALFAVCCCGLWVRAQRRTCERCHKRVWRWLRVAHPTGLLTLCEDCGGEYLVRVVMGQGLDTDADM